MSACGQSSSTTATRCCGLRMGGYSLACRWWTLQTSTTGASPQCMCTTYRRSLPVQASSSCEQPSESHRKTGTACWPTPSEWTVPITPPDTGESDDEGREEDW